jgi:inositol phosphorylceramide mannosyltransferase catalytic subunit
MRIPRIFHQIWLGADPLPEDYARFQESWLRHHPGWELRFWTEENLPEGARRPELYERLRAPAERSDVLRFELLWRHGGVYVDSDFECLRSIEPLIEDADFFVGYRKPGRVNNAIVGAVAAHPIVDRALDRIRPRATYGSVDKAGTGPLFLAAVLEEYPEVTIFEPKIFYPRTAAARAKAYAVHHRGRSWKDEEGLRSSLEKTEKRLLKAQEEGHRWRLMYEQAAQDLENLQARPRR